MTTARRVVVLGGGLAANTFAATARAGGFDGDITVLGDEPHTPYARPPLSKAVLAGRADPESTALPFDVRAVDFHAGTRVAEVDARRRIVTTARGGIHRFDALVVATGARARRLGAGLVVRTRDDATAVRARLAEARTAIVVGSGLLAWELASGCVDAGVSTTLVVRQGSLERVIGPFLAECLAASAVDAGLRRIEARDADVIDTAHAPAVVIDDDRALQADLVLTAIGCRPASAALPRAWRHTSGAVEIDDLARVVTASGAPVPDIFAAGDVTARRIGGDVARTPLWTPAIAQAMRAARTLLGHDGPTLADETPYAWTEAFGLDIKIAGTVPLTAAPEVDGDPRTGAVLRWPGAAASVNRPMPVAKLKRLTLESRSADLTGARQ